MFLGFVYLGGAVLTSYALYKRNEPLKKKYEKFYKEKLKTYFKENKLVNYYGEAPKYQIELTRYGLKLHLDISGICGTQDIENTLDYLKALYKAYAISMDYVDGIVVIDMKIIDEDISFLRLPSINLEPHKFLVGYQEDESPLIVDMKQTPHLLITGLSGQGKTGLLRGIIKSITNADVVLCNGFADDFKDFDIQHLLGEENISDFIQNLLDSKEVQKKPLYIILEELGTIQDKKLLKYIQELLMIGRHYNIYLIGIIQVSKSEDVKFKTFFNARLTFRQVDDSSYRVVLGASPKDENILGKREFYLLTDSLYKGRTYTV